MRTLEDFKNQPIPLHKNSEGKHVAQFPMIPDRGLHYFIELTAAELRTKAQYLIALADEAEALDTMEALKS